MVQPIEFHFDFSSPYAYLTAQVVDDLGVRHGREVAWKPFLLGVLFKVTGQQPLLNMPVKGDYARRDGLFRPCLALADLPGRHLPATAADRQVGESHDGKGKNDLSEH